MKEAEAKLARPKDQDLDLVRLAGSIEKILEAVGGPTPRALTRAEQEEKEAMEEIGAESR